MANQNNGNVNPAATTEEKKGGIFERLGKQMDKAIPILSKVVIGAALLGLGYVIGNGSRGSVDTPQIPPTIPDNNNGAGMTNESTNYGAF